MSTITQAIAAQIQQRGLDPAAVAKSAGRTPGQLERSITGARKLSATDLVGLCQTLGLSLEDLKRHPAGPVYDTDNGHDLYRVINEAGHTLAEFTAQEAATDYFNDVTATEEPTEEGDPLYPWAVIDPAGRIIEHY